MKNRTKDLIADTLLRLCDEMPLEKIAVQDVVEACDVSRQTFYYHFEDKQAVIEYVYLRTFSNLVEEYDDYPAWIERNAEFFDDHQSFMPQAFASTGMLLWLEDLHFETMSCFIVKRFGKNALTEEVTYALDSYVAGAYRMIEKSLTLHLPIDLGEQIRRDARYMPPLLRVYFFPEKEQAKSQPPATR